MKYSVATVSFLLAAAVAATPEFNNVNWELVENQPFTIKFSGCGSSGCTIYLKNGASGDLKDYKTLTSSASGSTFTFTPSAIPSDKYAFEIKDNASGQVNYSSQFTYSGTGQAATTAATTSAAATKAEKTSTGAASTTPAVKSTTLSKATSSAAASTPISTPASRNNTTTPAGNKTKTSGAKTTGTLTGSTSTSPTTVPNSGAARLSSSIALIAGAVVAMVYLN